MILIYDSFDSFTYNLVDYFKQIGSEILVIRNNIPIAEIQKYPIKGIVLSPGPGKPTDAGHMMNLLSTYHLIVPILGICLGHQALGIHFGADLMKAKKPMHGKTSLINIQSDYIFKG
ncbi:MAG: aminodeoxychorismate/anthranilate synthase component II, partial [Gammaproteobacteria bacterium]|nr:aminodeoxychorismate/anthranilate synthase component II [Gammaproteobacteria bacterium]